MSFSRTLTQLYIKTAVYAVRFFGWLKGGDSKKHKLDSELVKAKILTDYFAHKYLHITEPITLANTIVHAPETIWQFWDNPTGRTTPEIVKSSLQSVDRFKGDFKHKILNDSTFESYSDLPGYILDKFRKGNIGYTHFSDLLRLNLLKNHGGIWLDATGYMTNNIPQDILAEDFFVFLTGKLTSFPYSFIQNCFIRAKKNSFLCDAWYQICIEYWKEEKRRMDYFQHQLMFKALVDNQTKALNLFARMLHLSEDSIQQLVNDNLLKKFDAQEWEKIKNASFFQKTTYKVPQGTDYSGTYLYELSKGKY